MNKMTELDRILLDHGSGGKLSHKLISDKIVPLYNDKRFSQLDDGAMLNVNGTKLAFSTDSYTVDPIFFPGGDIGDLAINGTVNDVSMCGAIPLYISIGLIIEENFLFTDLDRILASLKSAADKAGVDIVTGDTKVVQKGAVDKIFINTSGIGLIPDNVNINGANAQPGDKIIVSGTIADHGITILIQRESMSFESKIKSDSAPLNHMVKKMLLASNEIHVLRDPTRGGLGTTLNEIALSSNMGIHIDEDKIPVNDEVAGICELLGFDPLYLANEGKLIAFVRPDHADKVLEAVKSDEYGKNAVIIGEVSEDNKGKVIMKTAIGGKRIVDMLTGEQLPRIC